MKNISNLRNFSFFTALFLLLISCGGVSEKDDKKKGAKAVNIEDVTTIYTVEALTNHEFTFNGGDLKKINNPDLTLKRGATYQFKVETFGHPFLIKTEQTIGPKNMFEEGVLENGIEFGTITFTVPKNAPDTLFYICKFHKMMTGKLIITD